jgi:hypothetical protein
VSGYEFVGLLHQLLANLNQQIGVNPLSEALDAVEPVCGPYGAANDRAKLSAAARAALGGHSANTNFH